MLNNLLSTNTQKQIIGISLAPGIGLEVVIYDRAKNAVLNYGRRKVEYNFSTREIQDYVQFKSALGDLMQEMNIPPKSLAFLVLPNVFFDFIEVPLAITEPEVKTALLSKAEEFYLFKKEEPVSGWCEVINKNGGDQKKLAYASFQRSTVDEIKDIFVDVGLQLVGIESSYTATIRGLYLSGHLDDMLVDHSDWAAMLVNTNSYTMLYFEGNNLLDCNEVPIAIKSFSPEEAYGAIASSASQLLSSFNASKLFIISQTDDVSSEVLKGQMQYDREIVCLDSNRYSKKPIIDILQSADFARANSMTLASVGASNIKTDFGLLMNVIADDPTANIGVYCTKKIGNIVVDFTKDLVTRLAIVIIAIAVLLFGGIFLICYFANTQAQDTISKTNAQIEGINDAIGKESKTEEKQVVDMNVIIDDIAQMNVSAINFYDSIANDIPKNIWLTKYYNKQGNKIVIQGVAESIVDIYEYFKNLKVVSPQSDIKLTELKVITSENDADTFRGLIVDSDKDRLYSFEIANTSIGYDKNSKEGAQQPVTNEDIIINANSGKSDKNNNANNGNSAENAQVEQMSDQAKPTGEE